MKGLDLLMIRSCVNSLPRGIWDTGSRIELDLWHEISPRNVWSIGPSLGTWLLV